MTCERAKIEFEYQTEGRKSACFSYLRERVCMLVYVAAQAMGRGQVFLDYISQSYRKEAANNVRSPGYEEMESWQGRGEEEEETLM